jgi:DNA mismatch repair protein MSH5
MVGQRIQETIDFEKSGTGLRTMVAVGVDPALDELKRQYDGMESLLAEAGTEMAQRMPEWARRHLKRCVYLPQLGFFSVVARNPTTGMTDYDGQGLPGDRWEQRFTEDDQAFCKNGFMCELDNHYGDIFGRIQGTLLISRVFFP